MPSSQLMPSMPNSSTTPETPGGRRLQRRESGIDQIGDDWRRIAYMPIAVKKKVKTAPRRRGDASRSRASSLRRRSRGGALARCGEPVEKSRHGKQQQRQQQHSAAPPNNL
jgi:hypothetical protein